MTGLVRQTGHRMQVVFEGRDAVGKGDQADRPALQSAYLPHRRPVRPNDRERAQWHFQR
ncbi:polyphosphate kinase 2 family protein [Gluconacetobacter azotocaptans]